MRAGHASASVVGMQIVIELDGPIVDIRGRYFAAHRHVQGELGLASREPNVFWRLIRTGSELAPIVKPYRPAQLEAYARGFLAALSDPSLLELDVPQPDVLAHLAGLRELAPCSLVVARPDRQAAQSLLDRHELWRHFSTLRSLSQDLDARTSQWSDLVGQDDQTLAGVADAPTARAAREAGAITVGIANGPCTPRRLRQAGADVVVAHLGELLAAIRTADESLCRAGYRPPGPTP